MPLDETTRSRPRHADAAPPAEALSIAPGDTLERGPYVDGFSRRTVLGALFVAVVMMPGSIYLGLVAGQSLGPAAEWVTIILFAEVARRGFAHLKRQEVFILFYVASAIAASTPFAGAMWNQYLLQSPQTTSIAGQIPDWVVPPAQSPAIQARNLAHRDWWWSASHGILAPCVLTAIGYILGRLSWMGLGYVVFRLTSDAERLPFPMAPIAAEGATALAESTDRDDQRPAGGDASAPRKRSWRWTVFSVGASMGIAFGALYVLVPVVSGLFMAKPIMLLPIPFVDFTRNVESILPASLISFSFDAMILLAGMILPFRLVMGTCTAILLTSVIGNPILQKAGVFKHWRPGNGLLVNQMILSFDFWLSVSIGLAGAVALIGIGGMVRAFAKRKSLAGGSATNDQEDKAPGAVVTAASSCPAADRKPADDSAEPPYRTACKQRGDFPIWVALLMTAVATLGFTWVSHVLVPDFPIWIILVFGFVWSPLHSYISARLIGLTGSGLSTPYLKETAFITSGYKRLDIWFAPIPLYDHGGLAQRFRELELTRTKFTSIYKAELLMFPIIFVCSFLFWWFFWRMNQIPSDQFPFAARTWPVAARQAYLIFTANSTDQSLLIQAIKPVTILIAMGAGLLLFGGLTAAGAPVTFFYGMIGGVGAPLHAGIALFAGAVLGRYYFARKFGPEKWHRYVPVLTAGFSCGMGLAGMIAVALSLVAQCTRDMPF